MLYKLTFKVDLNEMNNNLDIVDSVNQFENKYVQRFSWTNGHYVLRNYHSGNLEILIAYPSIKKPFCELIKIQEYLLDKLNIKHSNIKVQKWIEHLNDDINDSNLNVNSMIVRHYHQEHFFNDIIDLSIKYSNHDIAAIFYKNYYINSFFPYLFSDLEYSYKNIRQDYTNVINQNTLNQIDDLFSKQRHIFFINDSDNEIYDFKKYSLLKHLKSRNKFEQKSIFKTSIKDELSLENLVSTQDISFDNAVTGQVWEINIDINLKYKCLVKSLIDNILIPKIEEVNLRAIVLIKNPRNFNLGIGSDNSILI